MRTIGIHKEDSTPLRSPDSAPNRIAKAVSLLAININCAVFTADIIGSIKRNHGINHQDLVPYRHFIKCCFQTGE